MSWGEHEVNLNFLSIKSYKDNRFQAGWLLWLCLGKKAADVQDEFPTVESFSAGPSWRGMSMKGGIVAVKFVARAAAAFNCPLSPLVPVPFGCSRSERAHWSGQRPGMCASTQNVSLHFILPNSVAPNNKESTHAFPQRRFCDSGKESKRLSPIFAKEWQDGIERCDVSKWASFTLACQYVQIERT